MPSSATLQTPYSPLILQLPASLLAYFYSAPLVEFYSALDIDPKTPGVDQRELVATGALEPHHLANMDKHKYTLEPNVRFSPDHKLVIFNSNVLGPSYIFAVEVAKAKTKSSSQ